METVTDLDTVVRVVRDQIMHEFRADSCIASTRVTIDVLAYFGLRARPQAVRVAAWNTEGYELAKADVPVSDWPDSAYSIGISGMGGNEPGRWNGHLVAVTVDTDFLLDASLDQMSRPDRGITLHPTAFALPPGWAARWATEPLVAHGDGVIVAYWELGDQMWRTSTNYSRKTPAVKRATGAAIRRLTSLEEPEC